MSRLSGLLWATLGCLALAAPLQAADKDEPQDSAAFDMDRPGEVENPFSLKPGQAQVVTYVSALSADAREGQDLGFGGSATVLQVGTRFGIVPMVEGQVLTENFLRASQPVGDGDDGRFVSRSGPGYATVRLKATVFQDEQGEGAVGLVPFVRVSMRRSLTGASGAEEGVLVPFSADLEHGWELQGSTGFSRAFAKGGGRESQSESQVSLEKHLDSHWTVYVEPQLEVGGGAPSWSLEAGVSWALNRSVQFDLGGNQGLGKSHDAQFCYLGVAWNF